MLLYQIPRTLYDLTRATGQMMIRPFQAAPRALIASGLAASLLTGCASSQYTPQQLYSLSEKERASLARQADTPVDGGWEKQSVGSYENSKQLEALLGYLPQHHFTLYTPNMDGELQSADVDTTGHANASMDEIGRLVSSLPPTSHFSQLRLAPRSRNLLFGGAGENQLTLDSGLLAVSNYSMDAKHRHYQVTIDEVTAVNEKGNDTRYFRHRIVFPTTSAEAAKYRLDFSGLAKALEDTAIYGALAGEWSALGKFTGESIRFLAAGAEGRARIPKGTAMVAGRDHVGGLKGTHADAFRELQESDQMHGQSMFVVPYCAQDDEGRSVRGTAVVHASRVKKALWKPDSNTLELYTEIEGTNHFADLLARNLHAAALLGADGVCRHDDSDTVINRIENGGDPSPPPGGGQTGGEGGGPAR